MSDFLERGVGRLEGSNVPAEARIFPPQYAHFDVRKDFLAALITIRDQVKYETAYSTLWTALCMQIDFPNQDLLLKSARGNIARFPESKSRRDEEIKQYWSNLRASSIYPFYQRTRQKLEILGYGARVVDGWVLKPGENHRAKLRHDPNLSYLEAEQIFAPIHTYQLGRVSIGFLNGIYKTKDPSQDFRDLQKQLHENGAGELMGYTTLLYMLNTARAYSQDRIIGQVKVLEDAYAGRFTLEVPSWENKITSMLKDIEPYHHFQKRLDQVLRGWEDATFKDKALVAGPLWRSMVHLRYGTLPSGVSNASVRRPLVELLLDQKYNDARYYVEDLIARFPRILPEFTAQNLDIDPITLREFYQELAQQVVNAAANQESKVDPKKEVREKAMQVAEQYLDKEMISADGKLTLTIIKRTLKYKLMDSEVECKKIIYVILTNNAEKLIGRKLNRIIPPEDIPSLVEKFGFTFVQQ